MKDFYKDFGYNFIRIFKDKEVPSFMKEAEALEQEQIDALPSSAFADSDSRSFPITDAANVYVSAAYYYGANDKNASIEDRITKAAEFFEISDDVETLKQAIENGQLDKTASAEADQSWEVNVGENSFFGRNAQSIEKFADDFTGKLFDKFSFTEKVKIAEAIVDQMKDLGLTPSERILSVACKTATDFEVLDQQIRARAIRIPEDSSKVALLKIANNLVNVDKAGIYGLSKIAEYLHEIDERNSLNRFYGKSISDPFDSVFNLSTQAAEKLAARVEIGGTQYSEEDLKNVSAEIFKSALSEESFASIGFGTEGFSLDKVASLQDSEKQVLASYL